MYERPTETDSIPIPTKAKVRENALESGSLPVHLLANVNLPLFFP